MVRPQLSDAERAALMRATITPRRSAWEWSGDFHREFDELVAELKAEHHKRVPSDKMLIWMARGAMPTTSKKGG